MTKFNAPGLPSHLNPAMLEREWDKDSLNRLFLWNPRAVERAITHLYQRQTHDERASSQTRKDNGVGFTSYDAPFLSSLGKALEQGRHLTERQLAAVRKLDKKGYCMLAKYHGQLAQIITGYREAHAAAVEATQGIAA